MNCHVQSLRNASPIPPCAPARPTPLWTAWLTPWLCSGFICPHVQTGTIRSIVFSRSTSANGSSESETVTSNCSSTSTLRNNSPTSLGWCPSHPPQTISARRATDKPQKKVEPQMNTDEHRCTELSLFICVHLCSSVADQI